MDFDSDYRREEAIASVGGKHALFNAVQVLVNHHDEVIIPVPYWVTYKDVVNYAGGKCIFVETDEQKGFATTSALSVREQQQTQEKNSTELDLRRLIEAGDEIPGLDPKTIPSRVAAIFL